VNVRIDHSLLNRLPLPLAQLYRRSFDAAEPMERHQSAWFLWESSLRLLACTALVELAERRSDHSAIFERASRFDRYALGSWWGLTRDVLAPNLAALGDEGFTEVKDRFDRPSDRLPRCAELYAALEGGASSVKSRVDIRQLFDKLVDYRNVVLGHGAVGMDTPTYYSAMAERLQAALTEWFRVCDPLAGRRLLHVASTRRMRRGGWSIEYRVLQGPDTQPMRTLELSDAVPGQSLPLPEQLYLAPAIEENDVVQETQRWNGLRPLMVANEGHVYFYNGRKGRSAPRIFYLCYFTAASFEESISGQETAIWPELMVELLTKGDVDSDPAESPSKLPLPDSRTGSRQLPRFIGGCEILAKIGEGADERIDQYNLGRYTLQRNLIDAIKSPSERILFLEQRSDYGTRNRRRRSSTQSTSTMGLGSWNSETQHAVDGGSR
jgi:hypothetical protein